MSISTHGLSVTFNGKTCLKEANLSIKSGELTVLIGPNGAGKSTLLKACSGDLASFQGQINMNGHAIDEISPSEMAKTRAVMTQSYELDFSFSVKEIVAMGCHAYEERVSHYDKQQIIQETMGFLGISHLSESNFMTLSGGEKQRTQLARVLTQIWYPYEQEHPRFLLLDEPTSSLDIFHQYHVLTLAKQLTKRNIGVLAVLHDLSLAASFADQLILLKQGSIIAKGSAKEVLQRQHLEDVYQVKADYYRHSNLTNPTILLDSQQ
ncbi:heme ABC transporter ATP-binding protein [Marinomonas epiphytica]